MEEHSPKQIIDQQFQLVERLAQAGTHQSWKARRKGEDEAYVVKLFALDIIPSIEEFDRRLQSIGGLNHAGLLRRHGHLVQENRMVLWRPYLDGANAATLNQAPLPRILNAAQRVAEALHQAHRQGIAHAAIKPENIILSEASSATVVDFAPVIDAQVGPESGVGQDIFDLGQCLFGWLTGAAAPAGSAETIAQTLRNTLREDLTVPPALGRLVVSMLSADPADRPGSMLEVRDCLDDVRVAIKRGSQLTEQWDEASFVPPRPAGAVSAVETSGHADDRERSTPVPLILTAAAALLLVLAVVVVSRLAPTTEVPEPEVTVAEEAVPEEPPVAPQPPSQYELELLLRQREEAQAVLDQFINLQLELEEQKVERWAERRFNAALALARTGDEPFRNQQFPEAGAIYQSALDELNQVAGVRSIVLAEALERGALGLGREDAAAAAEAFDLALAIEPDNSVALAGRARAETLDQALSLLNRAREAEQQESWAEALDLYRELRDLDPSMPGVDQSVSRMQSMLADLRFRDAMSRGLNALARADWEGARQGFEQAQKMRPSDPAPRDGLIELDRRIRDERVGVSRELAQRAVDQERWEAAVKHFDQLLERDPNLAFAQEGKTLSEGRAELDRRLQTFTGSPHRWWSDKGRQEATSLLVDAQNIDNRGPRLQSQISKLEAQLELASRPITITLVSDNACDVVVYKVARLGQFQTTRLELLPGRYTAVGTRQGYRDERKVFVVPAGREPEPVVLRCEEQVLAGG